MGMVINGNWDIHNVPIIGSEESQLNSINELNIRTGKRFRGFVNVVGNNNSYNMNVFKVLGTIRVIDQYAIISSVVDISNMTAVYADLWDGTVSESLTLDGADLSGSPVGTFFTKDQDVTKAYSVSKADQCRVNEITATKELGKPFTVTQKNGVDTFIRFNYTTNTVLDFTMYLNFIYVELNSGELIYVGG